jgi:DNA-binding GntR family transcriptional regulator
MRFRKAQSTEGHREKEPIQLRDQALQGIRRLILDPQNSSLRDGDATTSERHIADRLSISRTPVREALAVLEQLGVLNQVPQVGIRVRKISLEEAADVLRIREGIETVAVERIVQNTNGNPEIIAELESAVREMDGLRNDVHRFMTADTSFHCLLVQRGGLGSRVGVIQSLRDLIHLHRLQQHALATHSDMSDIVTEHASVVNSLRSNEEQAVKAVEEHLTQTLQRLRSIVRETGTGHASGRDAYPEHIEVGAQAGNAVAASSAARR